MRVSARPPRLLLAVPIAALTLGGTVYQASNTVDPSYAGQSQLTLSRPTAIAVGDGAKVNLAQQDEQGYYQFTNLTATLTTAGSPVDGEALTFTVGGVPACVATTDHAGVAHCASDARLPVGDFPAGAPTGYVVTFAGDGGLAGSSTAADFSKDTGAGNN